MKSPHGNTVIWRYMSFEKLADIILRQKATFPRADKFPDRNELRMPLAYLNSDNGLAHGRKKVEEKQLDSSKWWNIHDDFQTRCDSLRKRIYLNCWTKDRSESYALWKIYLNGSPNGVAIKTTVSKLKKELDMNAENLAVELVTYSDYVDIENITDGQIICSKRKAYEYEKEVRFYINKDTRKEKVSIYEAMGKLDPHPSFEYDNSQEIAIKWDRVIDEIMISPFATFGFRRTVKEFLSHHSNQLTHLIKSSSVTE